DLLDLGPGHRRRAIQFDPHDRALPLQPDVQLQRGGVRARLRRDDRLDAGAAHLPPDGDPVRGRTSLGVLRGIASESPRAGRTMSASTAATTRSAAARHHGRRAATTAVYHAVMIVLVFAYVFP